MSWMRKTLLSVFHYPVKLLVKDHNIPANVEKELGIDRTKPIIYLLPTNSVFWIFNSIHWRIQRDAKRYGGNRTFS